MKTCDVVQFNEKHKWRGCFGFINQTKAVANGDVRYMVGVPVPEKGTAYIFVMESDKAIERIGTAIFLPEDGGWRNESDA